MITSETGRPRTIPARGVLLGVALLVVVVVANVVGGLVGPEHRVDAGDLVLIAIAVAVGAVAWVVTLWAGREPDHANRAGVVGLVLAVLGVLANVAFWTAVPVVLGVGGLVLGRAGVDRAHRGAGRRAAALAAQVVAGIALVLWVIGYFVVQDLF